jgi:hypothetical protein
MEKVLISDRLLNHLKKYEGIDVKIKKELLQEIIKIYGDFFYEFALPIFWHLIDIIRIDNSEIFFHWKSKTNFAKCPECNVISNRRCKIYKTRHIQDMPLAGMTVYHAIKANRYYCDNEECSAKTFVEQFEEVANKDARLSNRLKDFIVREAIESSCNGASKSLKKNRD